MKTTLSFLHNSWKTLGTATLVWGLLAATGLSVVRAQEVIDIDKLGGAKLIPITINGYSGEVDGVLKFDLSIQGFDVVGGDKAQYQLTGKNDSRVEGVLSDNINKSTLLSKAYSGGSLRLQAHALADDVIKAITGKTGISQTKIAFKVERGGVSELCVADYDGHNATVVTKDNNLVSAPCWVPGMRKLLYTSWKAGNPDILSVDISSGARSVFARYPGANFSPAVSPDGRHVAMILSKGGNPDLYVCGTDGSGLKRLTSTKEDESSPCWSPDSQTICFASRQPGRATLYTVSAAGGEMRRLSTAGALNTTEPDWSPDGRTIVFTSQMGSFEICTVPAGGGAVTRLVPGEDPSWAGNSRTLVFTRRKGGGRTLSLLDVPTKRVKDVAQISGNSSQPSWAK